MSIRATDEEKLAALTIEVGSKHHQLSLAKQLLQDIRRQRSACHARYAELSAAAQRQSEEGKAAVAPASSPTAAAAAASTNDWISHDEFRLLGEREVLIQALERVQNRKQATEQQLRIQFARQAALDTEVRDAQAAASKTRTRTSALHHKVRLLEQTLKQREVESKAAVSQLTECERRLRTVQESGKRVVADAVKWAEAKRVQRAECMALASAEDKLHLELQLLQRLNRQLIDWIEKKQEERRNSNAVSSVVEPREGDGVATCGTTLATTERGGASSAAEAERETATQHRNQTAAREDGGATASKLFDAHRHAVNRILVQTALQQLR